MGVDLGACVGRTGPKGSGFKLRNLLYLAIHFGGGRLVIADFVYQASLPDSLKYTDGAQCSDVPRVLRDVKGNTDVTLGPKVVYLIGLKLIEQFDQLNGKGCNDPNTYILRMNSFLDGSFWTK